MAFTLDMDEDGKLVRVTYKANTSFQDRVDVLLMLVTVLKSRPTVPVLIDTTFAETNMTADEQMEFGQLLSDNAGFFAHNRTAIVTHNNNPHPMILAEAYLTGFKNFCEFDTVNVAMSWLKGEIR